MRHAIDGGAMARDAPHLIADACGPRSTLLVQNCGLQPGFVGKVVKLTPRVFCVTGVKG